MSALWLITTYFNPLGWQSRRRNYHTFRRHLGANLLTVEWSPTGNFTLNEEDADLLVRVSGGDLMWQKERLINIGLKHLPDDCELVGWVDCDILFQDPYWAQQTRTLLMDHEVVQLFSTVEYLEPSDSLRASLGQAGLRGVNRLPSLSRTWRDAGDPQGFLAQEMNHRGRQLTGDSKATPPAEDSAVQPGMAWAARRSWLEQMGGLPDRAVIGGGDWALAYALLGCWGRFTALMQGSGLGDYCSQHSWQWAQNAKASGAQLGCLNGTILHLYHGDLADRAYVERYYKLRDCGFRPDEHLEPDSGGAWRFNAAAPAQIRQLMASYFRSRQEDATAADP